MSKTKFKFIGKEREFEKVKMRSLITAESEMMKDMEKANSIKDQVKATEAMLLAVGKMCEKLIVDFKAEEMLDAEPDEFYIAQALNLLIPYYKSGRPQSVIDELKNDIIDTVTMKQLSAGSSFQI